MNNSGGGANRCYALPRQKLIMTTVKSRITAKATLNKNKQKPA